MPTSTPSRPVLCVASMRKIFKVERIERDTVAIDRLFRNKTWVTVATVPGDPESAVLAHAYGPIAESASLQHLAEPGDTCFWVLDGDQFFPVKMVALSASESEEFLSRNEGFRVLLVDRDQRHYIGGERSSPAAPFGHTIRR